MEMDDGGEGELCVEWTACAKGPLHPLLCTVPAKSAALIPLTSSNLPDGTKS